MLNIAYGVVYGVALLLLIPVVVLFVECAASLFPPPRYPRRNVGPRSRVAVLIPAHNEENVIGETLQTILPQLQARDRLIVVADNCNDGTAAIARSAGAEVIERNDPEKRGKGYALDFGVRFLESSPPEILLLVDADCHLHDGSFDDLARCAAMTGRPCQGLYTLDLPPAPLSQDLLSAFAFRVKNVARALGSHRLGMPCFLTGTGMAFPWATICGAPLAGGNIVEDLQLSVDLMCNGIRPFLCIGAMITGRLPNFPDVALKQRTRWEHGHMATILTQVPRLLLAAFPRRLFLIGVALRLSVPPLSLLVFLWVLLTCSVTAVCLLEVRWPVIALTISGWFLFITAVIASWLKCGRDILPLRSLLSVPLYVAKKLPIHLAFLVNRERRWVSTERRIG